MELTLEELDDSAIGSPTVLIVVVEQAVRQNNWRVIGSIEIEPRAGYVQHGVAAIERSGLINGIMEDQRWATVGWARQADGEMLFHQGDYDLTREQALQRMIDRRATA